jgi:hypothetical protein
MSMIASRSVDCDFLGFRACVCFEIDCFAPALGAGILEDFDSAFGAGKFGVLDECLVDCFCCRLAILSKVLQKFEHSKIGQADNE